MSEDSISNTSSISESDSFRTVEEISIMATIPKLPHYDPKELDFDLYISLIETNFAAHNITTESKKKNLLLVSMGTKIFAILANLTAPDNPTEKSYDEIVEALKRHFITKPTYHRSLLLFQQRKKKDSESLKELYSDLKKLAKDCNFGATFDSRLRDQLFMAVDNLSYFKFLVAEDLNLDNLTSQKLLDRIQTLEKAHLGEGTIDSNPGVHKVHQKKAGPSPKRCKHCGFDNHTSERCRFKGYACRNCGVKGHLEKVCLKPKKHTNPGKSFNRVNSDQKSQIKLVEGESDYDDFVFSDQNDNMLKIVHDSQDHIYMPSSSNINSVKPLLYNFEINKRLVPFEIDSGACASIISMSDCRKLGLETRKTTRDLYSYGGNDIPLIGETEVSISFNNQYVKHVFYVANFVSNNLCGRDLYPRFGIYMAGLDPKMRIAMVSDENVQNLLEKYQVDESKPINDVKANIYVKNEAVPKFFKARQVPLAHKDLVNDALGELSDKGIIEPVKYSDWASPIVPVLKPNNTMRICVDFKYLNSVVNIERYPMPLLDDVLSIVSDNVLFSKIDMSNAYLQIEVAEEDRKYLVISTEKGLFQYRRLCFGLASAPGIFQRFLSQLLCDIEGVAVFLDDILICSKSKADQFQKVNMVLERLKSANVQLNKSKCEFDKSSLEFLGYVISDKGVSPCPSKVNAIKNAPVPTNLVELQSFIGLVTYYSRFIHKFSEILAPLYDLTKKDVKFCWEKKHQVAYNVIKRSICTSDLLACFTGKGKLILEVDASPVGVGAVLIQSENGIERPIAFASKKLSAAESNYSQTDREALGMVFGVSKFKYFVLGREFEFRTDHKPLLGLFGKNKSIPSNANARLVRWSILLSQYQYNLVHKTGRSNLVADALSRLPIDDKDFISYVPSEYINMVESLELFNYSFVDIKKLTKEDQILSKLLIFLKFGWPQDDTICSQYSRVKNEMSIHNDVIMFKNRIVVPSKIRPNLLNLLHVSHNGMVAMKAEARQNFWWPNISSDIEEKVKSCNNCTMANNQTSQPILSWSDPGKPWDRIHIDYCGPIDNKYFLVIVDSHSKFADVHICSNMTSLITIECLRRTFANFGIPNTVVSDNATYFVSNEIKEFYAQNNILLINPAPFNPSTNGLCERMVQTFKNGMKKLKEGSLNTRVCRFLYNYRRTVHSVTKLSPDQIMFNRKFKSPLNINIETNNKKEKYHDLVWAQKFAVGQAVFARNYSRGESWLPGIITETRGLKNFIVKVFGQNGDYVWRRHSDQLKLRYNDSQECSMPEVLHQESPLRSEESVLQDSERDNILLPQVPSPTGDDASNHPVVADVPVVSTDTTPQAATPSKRKSLGSLPQIEPNITKSPVVKAADKNVCTRSGRSVRVPARFLNS